MDLEKRMSLVAAKSWGYVYQNGSLHYPSFFQKKKKDMVPNGVASIMFS